MRSKRVRKAANERVLKKNALKRVRKAANGRILAKNVPKRVVKRGNGHKIEENVTKCSGRANKGPHQRPSGGRELAGKRILAERMRRVAKSSKFGIARECLEQAGFGAEPQ